VGELQFLDETVDVIEGVLDLVVGICGWQLQLENKSIKFVENNCETNVLSDSFSYEPFDVESHTLDAVNNDKRTITDSVCG